MKGRILTTTEFYQKAKMRYDDLCKVRCRLESNKKEYPSGSILISKSHNSVQFYERTIAMEKKGKYLQKSEKKKISRLLQKRYEQELLMLINKEIKCLEIFLNKSISLPQSIRNLYSDESPEIKKYICPVDISDEDFIEQWVNMPYEKKEIGLNRPELFTDRGEQVRSKSELNIANMLNKMNIPYRYECPLQLGKGIIIYPDFTTLDVANRCEIYWEHRGMMDDREYAKDSVKRVKDYGKEGIFLGDRLIITEETNNSPLDTNEIKRIIDHYLLHNY